uniref:Outer membrane protein (Porin) n=1 Tax=Candidatus Kentrum sp. FW TaxID=2126338 RepID=A0A450T6A6_9GAMM|nr:MAG: Outer membrane protein (porin) [Candidatus Kentron sp. FW]
MQKKLLSMAIAGALALPGAAVAELKNVDIYGKFHASWDFVDNESVGDDFDDNTGVFRNSRLGFKGSEKLSDGVKAIWQIETGLHTHGNDKLAMRNTYIGLDNDTWGTIVYGKHDSPYKTATAKLDIFSDTIADYNNIIGAHITGSATGTFSSNFNERIPQLVMYTTPTYGGFKARVARESWQQDENQTTTGNEDTEGWSAMGVYDKGPFFASLAYELFKGDGNRGALAKKDVDAWKLGLGYKLGNSKISVVYEDIDRDGSDAADKTATRDAFSVSLAHDIGSNTIKLAYAKANDSDASASDDGAQNWSFGVDHNFSKRTKIYAIYTRMDNDSNANYGLYGGQMKAETGRATPSYYTGGTSATSASVTGKDIDAMSFGIIHKF